MHRFYLFALTLLLATPAHAIRFDLPIRCEVGRECFIQKYVDQDASPDWRDYRCGKLSNDGHKGTDIRVPTLTEMEAGVEVLAAAGGKIIGVRDGVEDVSVHQADPETITGKECGNGVLITHEDGWQTQYCHLKKDSITIAPEEEVKAGDVLGLVGLSGNTEFPHVHFEVRRDTTTIDPFTGLAMGKGCGASGTSLWSEAAAKALTYHSTGLLVSGFTGEVPDASGVLQGQHRHAQLPADAPLLIFWAQVYGLKPEQRLDIRLNAPDGTVLAEASEVFDKHQAQFFKYIGLKRKEAPWPPGEYTGHFRITDTDHGLEEVVIDYSATLVVQ